MNPADDFRNAIASAGMEPPAEVVADGRIHRFSPTGKRRDDAAWYVLHLGGVPAGSFGNWRGGFSQCWCAKRESELSATERKALAQRIEVMRRQRDADQRQRHANAAASAATRWDAATPATEHPYLAHKDVQAHGLRIEAGRTLLVPMRDALGRLHGVQGIAPDGTKRFMPGQRVKGLYHAIGKPAGRLVVCEGYATGASIHEDSGHAVAVAFNAGNLMDVAKALRSKFPCLKLVVAADDDAATTGNPGRTYAEQAALAVGGVVVPMHPRRDPGASCDFNDLHKLAGPDAVRACLAEMEVQA
ncbi:toprim domain-containing protein [Acidovorax sp. SDU_ACID1]|uniref:toprim domain-containing protein n=1 Tax=Acidovorax sp. SDU_ACID1 TaxID=3136632 RepID=UPI00387311B0